MVSFVIMLADRAALRRQMGTLDVASDVGKFLGLALVPVAALAFAFELRARQAFAARHRMSIEDVGRFWHASFQLSELLQAAHLRKCLSAWWHTC